MANPTVKSQAKKKMSGGLEARRTPRRTFQRGIGILLQGKYQIVRALQLSEGGLLFVPNPGMAVEDGFSIVASIVLPSGGGAIVVRGVVIYTIKGVGNVTQHGVSFEEISLPQRRKIRNYVSAKTQVEAEEENADILRRKPVNAN